MAKDEGGNTQKENTAVDKQKVLKSLISIKDELSKADPSRELSLANGYLDNAIHWLKQDVQ